MTTSNYRGICLRFSPFPFGLYYQAYSIDIDIMAIQALVKLVFFRIISYVLYTTTTSDIDFIAAWHLSLLYLWILLCWSFYAVGLPLPDKARPESTISDNATACRDLALACVSQRPGYNPKSPYVSGNGNFPQAKIDVVNKISNAIGTLAAAERHICEVEHLPEHEAFYLDSGLDKAVATMNSLLKRVRYRGEAGASSPARPAPQAHDMSAKEQALMVAAPNATSSIVDTEAGIVSMLEALAKSMEASVSTGPQLAIHAEGDQLGREGTLTILTIHFSGNNHVFIIDVLSLGHAAFRTGSTSGNSMTLQRILEDAGIQKLLWDCRSDSEALHHHLGIELDGVIDLQLLDLATATKRRDRKKLRALGVSLLQRFFKGDTALSTEWRSTKDWGDVMTREGIEEAERMHKESGGDFMNPGCGIAEDRLDYKPLHAFAVRPLHPWLVRYCMNDVCWLPAMYWHFIEHRFWNEAWEERVEAETARRIIWSKKEVREMQAANAPAGWVEVVQVDKTIYC